MFLVGFHIRYREKAKFTVIGLMVRFLHDLWDVSKCMCQSLGRLIKIVEDRMDGLR